LWTKLRKSLTLGQQKRLRDSVKLARDLVEIPSTDRALPSGLRAPSELLLKRLSEESALI